MGPSLRLPSSRQSTATLTVSIVNEDCGQMSSRYYVRRTCAFDRGVSVDVMHHLPDRAQTIRRFEHECE